MVNIFPTDPIERAIFRQGLSIVDIHMSKELDMLLVVLNTREVLKLRLSASKALAKASEKQLADWQLIGSGYGVHWPRLDEHLSLKGFLRDAMMGEFIEHWDTKPTTRRRIKARA